MASNQSVEGVAFLSTGGVDEREIPELIPPEDYNILLGMVPKQTGELISIPGKRIISRILQGQIILNVIPFGNYILVQTNTNLIRFSNYEIFGGVDFTNDLTPDVYPTTSNEEESMAQIILKSSLPAGTNGTALNNAAWTQVPFQTEVRDTGGNCILAGNQFTLTAGVYPKNCRIKSWIGVDTGTNGGTNINFKSALFVPAVSLITPICQSLNQRIRVPAGGISFMENFFVLAAATTYDLRAWADAANARFGTSMNVTGLEEVYAYIEILIE